LTTEAVHSEHSWVKRRYALGKIYVWNYKKSPFVGSKQLVP
jgi:hypothetical protein